MKVLIDTNIILDFYCCRQEFYDNAAAIFDKACRGEIELWVSPISFVNFFYITRKDFTVSERYDILRGLLEVCRITPTDERVIASALSVDIPDFEDMVQLHSAVLSSVDCIVTRNVKDYVSSPIPVLAPSDFLAPY